MQCNLPTMFDNNSTFFLLIYNLSSQRKKNQFLVQMYFLNEVQVGRMSENLWKKSLGTCHSFTQNFLLKLHTYWDRSSSRFSRVADVKFHYSQTRAYALKLRQSLQRPGRWPAAVASAAAVDFDVDACCFAAAVDDCAFVVVAVTYSGTAPTKMAAAVVSASLTLTRRCIALTRSSRPAMDFLCGTTSSPTAFICRLPLAQQGAL